jgi:hypothetical protein
MSEGNNKKKYVVSTFGEQFYGRDAKENKALSTSFYGSCIVVGIHRPLPEGQQGTAKYDYKGGTSVFLTGRSAKTLAKILNRARLKLNAGEPFKSEAIPSGSAKDNIIEVADGIKYGCTPGSLALAVYKVENKKATAMDVFEFKNDPLIVGYDPSGEYEHSTIDTDAAFFIEQLEDFARGMTNGMVHAQKKENHYTLSKIIERQIQIASALGIKNDTATSRTDWNNSGASTPTNTSNASTSDALSAELEAMYQ